MRYVPPCGNYSCDHKHCAMSTEASRTRAAVAKALRSEAKRCGIALQIQLEDRAYAIENGADW